MHYCDNCHLVCEGPVCPYCGKAHLRAPENSDYCYLATMVSPWGEAMQELLKAMQEYAAQQAAQRTSYSGSTGGGSTPSGAASSGAGTSGTGGAYENTSNASGAYTGEDLRVLCVCVSKFEEADLYGVVHELDPNAFFITQEGVTIHGNFIRKLS